MILWIVIRSPVHYSNRIIGGAYVLEKLRGIVLESGRVHAEF
jgi:hypothetical protein